MLVLYVRLEYGSAMQTAAHTWNVLEADTPILTYTYSFGPATANALAVRGAGDGLVVVSPPWRVNQTVFEHLRAYGPVRALVASNAFHYLGISEWKKRFPDAAVFAPAQSIERVARKTGVDTIRPLGDSASFTGNRVELLELPYYRTGEALVRIRTSSQGVAWYVTDVILNLRELPQQPVLRMLFKLSGNAPGLRFNNIAPLFMMRDRNAVRRWLAAEYRNDRPRWIIATHGELVDCRAHAHVAERLFEPYQPH